MRIRLTLSQLEAFVSIADHRSFRGAARAINLSQPALSRTIRIAEDTLHTRLFDRDKQTLELTASGRELLPIARRILGEFDTSFTELGRFLHGDAGRVAVAALPSVAVQILPEAIAAFRKMRPGVIFVVRDDSASALVVDLLNGAADFAITAAPAASDKVEFKSLVSDDFVLACRRDHPLADAPELLWTAFAGQPFIAIRRTSSVRLMTDEAFRREGMDVVPVCEVGSWALAGRLIREGVGISAIPRLTASLADRSDLTFVRLMPTLQRKIGILTVKGRTLPPASQEFLEFLLQRMTALPDAH